MAGSSGGDCSDKFDHKTRLLVITKDKFRPKTLRSALVYPILKCLSACHTFSHLEMELRSKIQYTHRKPWVRTKKSEIPMKCQRFNFLGISLDIILHLWMVSQWKNNKGQKCLFFRHGWEVVLRISLIQC